MKRSGASIVIESLCRNGAETVFGYPGGAVLPIYDELYKNAHRLNHVLCLTTGLVIPVISTS